jgi:hypothetical protein
LLTPSIFLGDIPFFSFVKDKSDEKQPQRTRKIQVFKCSQEITHLVNSIARVLLASSVRTNKAMHILTSLISIPLLVRLLGPVTVLVPWVAWIPQSGLNVPLRSGSPLYWISPTLPFPTAGTTSPLAVLSFNRPQRWLIGAWQAT